MSIKQLNHDEYVAKLEAERDALAAKVVKLEGTINDADPAHKRCRARVTALKAEYLEQAEALMGLGSALKKAEAERDALKAENDRLRAEIEGLMLECGYKPEVIEDALKAEDD
jgi:chromosome segregation ATPase